MQTPIFVGPVPIWMWTTAKLLPISARPFNLAEQHLRLLQPWLDLH